MAADANPRAAAPVIVYSPNFWDEPWTSRHRIATGLGARGWPVTYTSGTLSTWQRDTELWNNAGAFGAQHSDGGIHVDRPGLTEAHWPRLSLWSRAALAMHAARLRRQAKRRHGRGSVLTAFVFHPKYWPSVQALKPDRVVHFVYDANSLSPGWNQQLADWEFALVERADLIVGYSAQMFQHMPARAAEIGKVMPTGVDYAHFADAASQPCPADLAAVPAPRIGYTGHINQKLDLAAIVDVAARQPSLNFVFVGPAGSGNGGVFQGHANESRIWAQLAAMPNVHHLGPKPFSEVPAYMAHMDVNIMCYRLEGGWWQAGYPLKMHEYLAIGKPVVSTGLQTILPFHEVIDIVDSTDTWISALNRALTGGGVGTPDSRRAVARANSWDVRLDNLDRWMLQATGVGT